MKKFFGLVLLVGLILPFVFTGTVLARDLGPIYEDKIIFGDDYTLASGQILDGDLLVFGGNVTIEDGATVTKSVVVFGGNIEVAGKIDQDIVVFGGSIDLKSTAAIEGRLVTLGGSVNREEGAVVSGGESDEFDPNSSPSTSLPFQALPFLPFVNSNSPVSYAVLRGIETVGRTLALGLLALLVAAIWPVPTRRVSTTLTATPVLSGGLGLLTLIAVPILIVVLSLTICLIPVAVIGGVLYGLAILFGWLALGAVVGERLAIALNWRTVNATLATALGTLLLSLLAGMIDSVPDLEFIGFMVKVIIAAIGVGAVVLTHFGTRPYLAKAEPGVRSSLPLGPLAPAPEPTPAPISMPPITPSDSDY